MMIVGAAKYDVAIAQLLGCLTKSNRISEQIQLCPKPYALALPRDDLGFWFPRVVHAGTINSVHVVNAKNIRVPNGKFPDAQANQLFDHTRPDPAGADNANMKTLEIPLHVLPK